MAVTFSKELSTDNYLTAYNNNIVKFTSDAIPGGETIIKATININGKDLEITPINNVFRYNFREVISVLINPNNFSDDIVPVLVFPDDTTNIYNDTDNTFINPLVTFTITFSDDTTDSIGKTYKWLKGVENLEDVTRDLKIKDNDVYLLSPFNEGSTITYDVVYNVGYPFDLSILLSSPGVVNFKNETTGLDFDFTLGNTVNRVFLSDGRINVTIEDYLTLIEGLNRLKITRGSSSIFINLTKISSVEGQYVKWLNQYSGWSYKLFNCIHKRQNNSKDLGDVNNDFEDITDTNTPSFNIGKTSKDTLTLLADGITRAEQRVLDGIIDSPRVYYFTGQRFSQVNDNSWIAVKKKNTSDVIVDYKKKLKNYKITIELPQRNTMTL